MHGLQIDYIIPIEKKKKLKQKQPNTKLYTLCNIYLPGKKIYYYYFYSYYLAFNVIYVWKKKLDILLNTKAIDTKYNFAIMKKKKVLLFP